MRIILLIALWVVVPAWADVDVDALLAADEEPAGVVFEIVEGDEDALTWALPKVEQQRARLLARFPELHIAVVTHGREQFGLLADEAQGSLAPVHKQVQKLRAEGVDLHVCGVHAGWEGNTPEDYPAYVDVSASGPAQIRDYRNLGYVLIQIQE